MKGFELEQIRDLIYKQTGMRFLSQKDYFIKSKIEQRISELSGVEYMEYVQSLLKIRDKKELQEFLERITINETYFFRDFPQLQGFAENVLPEILEQKRKNNNYTLRVWSAACSTGEEPYTLAIILKEIIDEIDLWKIEIFATDIDREVLRKAINGKFSHRSLKDTPVVYLNKYFSKIDNGFQVLKDKIFNIHFSQLNLSNRIEMSKMRNFDIIFCRNVLIYFDEESRKRVVNQLYDSLNPQGFLFLGHSESVGRITAIFKLKNIGGFLCYQKP